MGGSNSGSNSLSYNPSKLSANEALGFNAGKTRYQMNTPQGLLALSNPVGWMGGAYDLANQNADQKALRQVRPGYEQEAESQGLQARQQSIASGTGGGGVQTATDTQAYNRVMAQYAALRQAMQAQRMAKQMQMYGSIGQLAGMFLAPGAGAGAGQTTQQPGIPVGDYYGAG